MNRELAFYIENEEQLKNPVFVYTVMMEFMQEVGEDLIDYNENLIDGEKILDWILEKGYITKDKHDEVIENGETWIQDLLLGYETGLINGECQFPSHNKAYQVIAEYVSEHKELREEIIYNYCTSFDEDNGDESRSGMSGSYDDESGHPLSSCIYKCDLETGTMTKEEWLNSKWNADISFTDEYNYLSNMSFEECDELSKNN